MCKFQESRLKNVKDPLEYDFVFKIVFLNTYAVINQTFLRCFYIQSV